MIHDSIVNLPVAFHASAGNAPPQWIQLVAAGRNMGRDGRGPYEIKEPQAVIRRSLANAAGGVLPVDINHSIDLAAKSGGSSPAAGWVDRMEWRDTGLWGRAEWTPEGAKALRDKAYRFISPVLAHDGKGGVIAVLRASLTNNPNLPLVALNAAGGSTGEIALGATLLSELRPLLGLPETADEAEVLAKARDALTSRNAVDTTRYVPIELFQETLKELNTYTSKGMNREDAEIVVRLAEEKRLLMPFMREWAVDLCMQDKEAYNRFIDGAGVKVHGFIDALTKPSRLEEWMRDGSHPRERAELHERQRLNGVLSAASDPVARNLGHTDEDMRRYGGNV